MLPINTSVTSFIPQQATLVSAPVAASTTLRVLADNVPASVSNVQINNNASNNNSISTIEEEDSPVDAQSDASSSTSPALNSGLSSAPATFITQLISQEVPSSLQSSVQGVLAEYEKLVAFSYVKYKPSNATLPPSSPSGVFGRLLQEEKADQPQTPTPQVNQPVQASVQDNNVAAPGTPPATEETPQELPAAEEQVQSNQTAITSFASPPAAPQASQAYGATATRTASQISGIIAESA